MAINNGVGSRGRLRSEMVWNYDRLDELAPDIYADPVIFNNIAVHEGKAGRSQPVLTGFPGRESIILQDPVRRIVPLVT